MWWRKGMKDIKSFTENCVINLYFSRDGMVITLLPINRITSFMPLSNIIMSEHRTRTPKNKKENFHIDKWDKNDLALLSLNRDWITVMENFFHDKIFSMQISTFLVNEGHEEISIIILIPNFLVILLLKLLLTLDRHTRTLTHSLDWAFLL